MKKKPYPSALSSFLSFFHQITIVQNRSKHRINSHWIIHCPTSEEVSEVSEWANKWAQWSAQAKQANAWAMRANKWTEERVSQYFSLYSWLFWTIVRIYPKIVKEILRQTGSRPLILTSSIGYKSRSSMSGITCATRQRQDREGEKTGALKKDKMKWEIKG